MKKKYYWKVVRVVSPRTFKSAYINKGDYSLTYKVGIPTKSPMEENGIFVFGTRKNARNFIKFDLAYKTLRIFKCKVEGEEIPNPIRYVTMWLSYGEKHKSIISSFPFGTKSFPSVTLIK